MRDPHQRTALLIRSISVLASHVLHSIASRIILKYNQVKCIHVLTWRRKSIHKLKPLGKFISLLSCLLTPTMLPSLTSTPELSLRETKHPGHIGVVFKYEMSKISAPLLWELLKDISYENTWVNKEGRNGIWEWGVHVGVQGGKTPRKLHYRSRGGNVTPQGKVETRLLKVMGLFIVLVKP